MKFLYKNLKDCSLKFMERNLLMVFVYFKHHQILYTMVILNCMMVMPMKIYIKHFLA